MEISYILSAIAVMALVTYLPRVLPLTIFRGEIKYRFIRNFLQYIPYACLGAMTFPGVFFATESMPCAIISAIIAVGAAYFGGSLLIVAIVAVIVVLIGNMFIG